MADMFTKARRSEMMSLIRSFGNKSTEVRLVSLFRKQGIVGWRRHKVLKFSASRPQPRSRTVRPDFVFPQARVAIFVDGCFWHGCPRHSHSVRQNRVFWETKLARNKSRDRAASRGLERSGWTVLRIWECALSARRISATLRRIQRALA